MKLTKYMKLTKSKIKNKYKIVSFFLNITTIFLNSRYPLSSWGIDIYHAQLADEKLKAWSEQSFCKNVSYLLCRWNKWHAYNTSFEFFLYEMSINLHMFSPIMLN